MPGYLLSPKVTNNIAQGKAASAATLGIGQQRIRSLKGSNNVPAFTGHLSFTSVARNVLEIRGTRQEMTITSMLSMSSPSHTSVGQRWDNGGTRLGQIGKQ